MRKALSFTPSGIGTWKNSGARVSDLTCSRNSVFASSTWRAPFGPSDTSVAAPGIWAVEAMSTMALPSGATLTRCEPGSVVTRISEPPLSG